jgi:hypothetical protein
MTDKEPSRYMSMTKLSMTRRSSSLTPRRLMHSLAQCGLSCFFPQAAGTDIFERSFSQDRAALVRATNKLRNASGNVYYNDKCTGAVVGQQPFGGGRASGTNDKAGSISIFYRFVSPRSIKETFVGIQVYEYPSNLL